MNIECVLQKCTSELVSGGIGLYCTIGLVWCVLWYRQCYTAVNRVWQGCVGNVVLWVCVLCVVDTTLYGYINDVT